MSNQIKGFSDLISERKASPLKFAWDKFKDIGAIRTATPVVAAPKSTSKPQVDPIQVRAQEYQALVTKKQTIALRVVSQPAVSTSKSSEPVWAKKALSQGLHQSNPQPRLDLTKPKAEGILFLLGA